jgi:DivIVA domain-containing protein
VLTVLAIIAVLAVLFVAGVVATREGPILADARPDVADLDLPADGLQPEDVREVRFGLAVRGYRMSEVDQVLDRLSDALAERDAQIVALQRKQPVAAPEPTPQPKPAPEPQPEPAPGPTPQPEPEPGPDPTPASPAPSPIVPTEPPLDTPPPVDVAMVKVEMAPLPEGLPERPAGESEDATRD